MGTILHIFVNELCKIKSKILLLLECSKGLFSAIIYCAFDITFIAKCVGRENVHPSLPWMVLGNSGGAGGGAVRLNFLRGRGHFHKEFSRV